MREPLTIVLIGRACAMKTVFREPAIGYGIFERGTLVVYRPGAAINRGLAEFSAAIAACESLFFPVVIVIGHLVPLQSRVR